jgi:hypothetical protein
MPKNKPKGKELNEEQKQQNMRKAAQRIIVEHAIRGIKKSRIVKDKI